MISLIRKEQVDWTLFWFIALSINLFKFTGFDLKTYQFIHLIIFCYLLWIIISKRKKNIDSFHYKSILLMITLPLLSIYSCNVINGQSYFSSLIIFRMHLGWLVYFYLWNKKLSYQTILQTILLVGIIYMLITLVQQISYPFAPFGERTLGSGGDERFGGAVERRMGFYRFAVGGLYYCILSFFMILASKLRHRKVILLALSVGIVASGNRQTIFSIFISVIFYYMFEKQVKNKWLIMLLLISISGILYVFSNTIFGRLSNVEEDLESGRMPSYIFYIEKILQSPLSFWFGNGLPSSSSEYGQNIDVYGDFRVTPSDIGIVGTAYYWGVLYVGIYLLLMFRWMINKHLSTIYKAIVLSFILCCPIASFLFEIEGFLLQGILFYLCDLDINHNIKYMNYKKNKTICYQ